MADTFLSRTGYRPVTAASIPGFEESAQDAVGAALNDTPTIGLAYSDVGNMITADLLDTTVVAGSYGSSSQVSTYTVDPQGRLTASADVIIAITASQVTDFTESAQDATGAMVDSTLVYVDATPLLTRAALTGDISAPQASNATTLATVNANVGTFGTATQVSTVTVNAKGLTTAASNTLISIPSTQVTDFNEAAQDAIGGILTDTATIDLAYNDGGNTITATLLNTTVVAGTYTESTITVDAQGRITAAASKVEFTSSDLAITAAGALTIAHGLGAVPHHIHPFLVCQSADLNYTAGDIVPLSNAALANNQGVSIVPDATNLNIRFGSQAAVFSLVNKTTGATQNITPANWLIRFYAEVNL